MLVWLLLAWLHALGMSGVRVLTAFGSAAFEGNTTANRNSLTFLHNYYSGSRSNSSFEKTWLLVLMLLLLAQRASR